MFQRTPLIKLSAVLCLGLVMGLGGCQNYREDGSRTIGEFTDDVGIQANVKRVLVRDPEINGLRLNVEVRRGEVTLYGRVPSSYARKKIVELAAGVRGVVRVNDKLTLVTEG